MADTNTVLDQLALVLNERKGRDPNSSYVASLYAKGSDKIAGKMAEECMETGLAAKEGDAQHLIAEMADLWFHSMVLLAYHNLSHRQVLEELARRFGVSGHVEKRNRHQ